MEKNTNLNQQSIPKNTNGKNEKKDIEFLVTELKEIVTQALSTSEIERESGIRKLNSLRQHLIEAIGNPLMVDALTLKMIYQKCFNLPIDTPEMMQLHQLMSDYEARFSKIERENRFLKWGLVSLAIGSGILNVASWEIVQQILRGIGIGF